MDTQHLEILLTLHLIQPIQQCDDNSNVLDKHNRTEPQIQVKNGFNEWHSRTPSHKQ